MSAVDRATKVLVASRKVLPRATTRTIESNGSGFAPALLIPQHRAALLRSSSNDPERILHPARIAGTAA
ncbi:hypothetical protein [Acidithrix sp. C25]|uniref:hypothetical protein n=1 Tax=Acidithrix sp. C25 TaxID=1671482 RepID=UPI00191BB9A3|nr:hypothetical protein [Acidithrix sp. C25]